MSLKTEKSPSILGVYFCAVLMALLGVVLGFAYLLTFPGQAFSSQKEYEDLLAELEEPIPAPKPGDAYYVEGPVLRTRSWEAKRLQLSAEGAKTVRFNAGEINAWMTAKFRPGATSAGADESGVLIVPGVPNVALTDGGTMYLNLPVTVTAYGSSFDLTVSARCVIDSSQFQLKTVQVSSAKIPFPELLGTQLLETLSKGYESTEEYAVLTDTLARAESIQVEGGELVLSLR